MKRVLVYGGRKWGVATSEDSAERRAQAQRELTLLRRTLRLLLESGDLVITGGGEGADRGAGVLARQLVGVDYLEFKADWDAFGKMAGPARNQQMIEEGLPDIGVGFPGGKGSEDMRRRLHGAGIPVVEIPNLGY